MIPCPISLGLTLREKVIIEEGSRNPTLVTCFTKLFVDSFPTEPEFSLHTVLTDGHGDATMDVVITELATDTEIHRRKSAVHFQSRTAKMRLIYKIKRCSFPAQGKYQVSLLIDGEWVANRDLVLLKKG
jgi:hypothetical protein